MNSKLSIIRSYNTVLMCEYYQCPNRSKYIIGNPGGPISMVHTLCEEHLREVVAEGHKLFPDIAGLDLKIRAAEVEAETAKADLSTLKETTTNEIIELQKKLDEALQASDEKQKKIDTLEKVIVNSTVAKSQEDKVEVAKEPVNVTQDTTKKNPQKKG